MNTIEVSRQDWKATLRDFAQIHAGWLISVEVLSAELGAQPEIRNLPLLDIRVDPPEGGDTISIAAAGSPDDHVTHPIQRPTRLWIERTDEGADAALLIESADGVRTILRLRTAVLPETVDQFMG